MAWPRRDDPGHGPRRARAARLLQPTRRAAPELGGRPSPVPPHRLPLARRACRSRLACRPSGQHHVHNRYRRRSCAAPFVVIGAAAHRPKESPMKYMMLIADSEDGMATSTEEEKATYARIGAWWN